MSEFAALYALGHEEEIKSEFKFEDNLYEFCTNWRNQPANTELPKCAEWNIDKRISISSLVLGVKFNIDLPNDKELLMFSEALLSAIECFLTTGLAHRWFPFQAKVDCILKIDNQLSKISYKEVEDDCGEITIHILVPHNNILSLLQNRKNHDDIFELVIKIICKAVSNQDDKHTEDIFKEDLALDRMNHLINLPTILDNILISELRYSISQWEVYATDKKFTLLRDKPWSNNIYHSNTIFKPDDLNAENKNPVSLLEAKHNEIVSVSVINMRLWDKAKWSGTLYAFSPDMPIPILGLMFRNEEALKIFNGWKKRFGNIDVNDEINISIITGVDKNHPHHYKVMVSPNLELFRNEKSKLLMCMNRWQIMTPSNSINLDNFKKGLSRGLGYFLVPARYSENSEPQMAGEKYWIKKNKIKIIEAWKIGKNDMEAVTINADDDLIIPNKVQ